MVHAEPLVDGTTPDLRVETAAMAVVGNSVLTFAGQVNFRLPETTNALWNLTMRTPNQFHWARLEPEIPELRRTALAVGGVVGTRNLVFFGGSVGNLYQEPYSTNETWVLDLESLVWEKKVVVKAPPDRLAAAGTVLQGSLLVVFGGVSIDLSSSLLDRVRLRSDTWGY